MRIIFSRLSFWILVLLCLFNFNSRESFGQFSNPLEDRSAIFDGSTFVPTFQWDSSFPFDEYELGPGDVLNFHMWGGRTLNVKIYVSANYQMFIPFAGAISVKGVTLGQVGEIINKKLAIYLKNTFAIVALQKPREFSVGITGAVVNPGMKFTNALTRLHEFIGKAGGLMPEASMVAIEIRNENLKYVHIINYQDYLLLAKSEGNPFLKDGDRILVPFQKNVVVVKGNVMRPGRFEFETETIPLKKVVEEYLGGMSKGNNVGGDIVITRLEGGAPKTTHINHNEFFDPKAPNNYFNFILRSGDFIYFPIESVYSPTKSDLVYVTGEVKVGGSFPFKPGVPLATYISTAGGISSRANYDGTVVYKASGQKVSINENVPIEPGDTIYVPEKTFKFWQDHIAILSTMLGTMGLIIGLSR